MKKTMKTMLAFVAGALALSACNNEDAILNENQNENENGAKLVTLTAYQEGEGTTRAAIDGSDKTKINWTASDAIKVFGTSSASAEYTTTTGGSTSANFTGSEVTGAAYALYPYQSTASCTDAGVITAEVPMTQYAVDGSFDPKAALMVGAVSNGSVEFKNVMSYVKVIIPLFGDGKKCKQVTIKAKDEWVTLAGKVNITVADAPTWAETTAKEGQAFVRLVPASGDQIAAGTYYIAVLPQTMSTGFEVIYNVDDVIYYKQTVKSDDATKKFLRNNVKFIGQVSVNNTTYYNFKVEATVDLTVPSGASYTTLKMADRNIGAATTDAYGDYFAWGALRPAYTKKPASGTTLTDLYWSGGFTSSHVPSTFTDIAAMLWGGKWRMATQDEWSNNTTNTSVKGLPRAGCFSGNYLSSAGNGFYWSSTPNVGYACYLDIYSSYAMVYNSGDRYYGHSVRPVLAQ